MRNSISPICLLLFLQFVSFSFRFTAQVSPYLSPVTFFPNYQKMLQSFKIYIYEPQEGNIFNSPPESIFYTQLLLSHFVTQNPDEAHLFFVPFSGESSTRSISRYVKQLRTELPYWNRTLGADHFYISCNGIGYESDRNLVELKKNAVQISCFPASHGRFIPHKDITFPALLLTEEGTLLQARRNGTEKWLGHLTSNSQELESMLVNEVNSDAEFSIGSESSDHIEGMRESNFCLFNYSLGGDVSRVYEALRFGCVPVVITDRPIQDMPFMDVLTWSEIAVFVGAGGGGGAKELKHLLARTWDERGEKMRELGMAAAHHMVWNEPPEPYDAFHTMVYQLWLRRHTIRYARRE